ncbi:Uncharacterised protein [Streptococcus suis]|uniref:Uncharacterized protein n=1 Tax=Streptococcus suis TaxID=1307 RepID=A0A0Z8JES3_STRSU|nr:Uncharacterised protein [Streptococcus suis]
MVGAFVCYVLVLNKDHNLIFRHAGIAADLDASRFSDEETWDGRNLVVVAKGLELRGDLAGIEEVDSLLLVLGDLVEFWRKAVAVRAGCSSDEENSPLFGG